MKILHVLRTVNPSWGGPVEGVKHLAAQARLRGHRVQVACLDHPEAPWLAGSCLDIEALGPARLGNFGFTRRLDSWLSANIANFDVVVVNGIWMYFSDATRRAATRAQVPYVVFPHGALDPWFKRNYPLKQVKKTAYWTLVEHKVFRDAAAVMFTSTEEQRLSHGAFRPYVCNARLTGYGIADPLARPTEGVGCGEPGELQRILPGLGGRRYLLFLARIHQKKGVDLFLRAIDSMRNRYRDHAFVIAGPGSVRYVSQMKSLGSTLGLDDRVIWAGALYGGAKWAVMRGAEAYVLPSHQENFGISVVESLACGVPVLITNRVNIWSEILAGDGGLVDEDDLSGICRLLNRWSELRPEEKKSMRDTARWCFQKHFDIGKTSTRFFDLLMEANHTEPSPSVNAF